MKKSLPSSEWLLVASLLMIMASLVVIAKVNAYRAASSITAKDLQQEEIWVTIEGAVAKPGRYRALSGQTIGEVVRKARPNPFADLKKIPLKEIVEAPMQLQIEELSEVQVFIQGAVAEPVEIRVPARTRICDLKSKVSLTAEADKTFFRRRKMVKDGEILEVPKKTIELNSSN